MENEVMEKISSFIVDECKEFWDISGSVFDFLFMEGRYQSFNGYNELLKAFMEFRHTYDQAFLKFIAEIEDIEKQINTEEHL
ncbi:hypothetical protein ACTNBL_02450 [Enterococcus villorum]|uniref:Uncharacterized protein n=2 Tax=Enterococcus villorum TaxID=112904 RepID=A0A511IYA0_9ENTE|nr:hypothetical protein [Enterococcus villorum]EOH89799.1 hypothetical protein UAO_01043 [Enterococcus villorum ATCC 700913]EOW78031.1 hypothetical protein I591_00886 [Enterococcus villorum ATCC 700913]GEL90748.1 hypothetical protein EVI01_00850 [Enterococcus villorum]